MSHDVICLRPEVDFQRVAATPGASIKVAYRTIEDDDLTALLGTARALVISAVGPRLPASLFDSSSLKMVQVTGAGVDRLDEEALTRRGVAVCNVPGGSSSAVAEYAVTSASLLLRRFAWADQEIRNGNYVAFRAKMLQDNLMGLEGLTVGVVGLGTIGLAVATAFAAMGCKIVYFDSAPRDPQAAAALGARSVALDELLRISDVVSLHVPLTPTTRGLIGSAQLAAMKPTAVLIHAARGSVVDEMALAAHLESGRLGGAAVDVYSQEPPAADHPLLRVRGEGARRLLLTPHIAGVMRQSLTAIFRACWDNVEGLVLRGESPRNRVY